MPRDIDFEHLAQAAVFFGRAIAVSYRTDVRAADGSISPVSDTAHDFDAAYDDYVESHKWWPHEDLICWEISADGAAIDVTDRMIYEAEMLCEQRGIPCVWEVVQ